jgi:anti-sigma factor RsiW
MRQCLDEGMLQSYFDGELPTSLMESATSHLASCASCAAAARELEEENALLSEAFALEFSESVPTERLRRRVDAAVAGLQIVRPVVHQPSAVSGFFSSLSNLFSFAPQRALGYAALMVVVAFGVIFGLVKLRSSAPTTPQPIAYKAPESSNPAVATATVQPKESVNTESTPSIAPAPRNSSIPRRVSNKSTVATIAPKPAPVKLLPGERAYLQTIAKLDSTIKQDENNMRPALQAEYQRNLAVVDRAIAASRTAAKKNPNDPDAADFMFAAYQSKVDFLNTIADARVYNGRH